MIGHQPSLPSFSSIDAWILLSRETHGSSGRLCPLLANLLEAFETFLGVPPGSERERKDEDAGWQYARLTDDVVNQVYQEYVRDFWASASKGKKRKKNKTSIPT